MIKPLQSPALDSLKRYGLAVLLAFAAAGLAYALNHPLFGNTGALFYAAVILSAWWGGIGPALLATAIDGYFSGSYSFQAIGSPGFGLDNDLQVVIFVLVAILISSLTSLRKRAEADLRRSHDELEIRIEQRTRELRESEERFRLLVAGVADYALVMLDAAGKIVSWNSGAQRIFGLSNEQAVNQDAATFYTHEDIARAKPAADLDEAARIGRHEDEGWRVRADSSRFWANVIITALRDESGRPRGFAQVTRDVTAMRSLEREVLDISEREQLRMGHDLHDGVGQELTGIALLAQNLQSKLSQQGRSESLEAARIASLVSRALDQTRKLSRGFSPLELGPEGLETALRDMAAKVQASSKTQCVVICQNAVHIPDDSVALHLYRIAQEAVTNAVRHASARQIRIELGIMNATVTLNVHDDGVGLAPAAQRGTGMGISVMQYRARMIGATLELRPGKSGTSVVCSCSLSKSDESNSPSAAKAN